MELVFYKGEKMLSHCYSLLLCVRYNECQNNTENRNLTLLGSKNNIILDLLQLEFVLRKN